MVPNRTSVPLPGRWRSPVGTTCWGAFGRLGVEAAEPRERCAELRLRHRRIGEVPLVALITRSSAERMGLRACDVGIESSIGVH